MKSAKSFSSHIVGFVDIHFVKKNLVRGNSCTVDQKKSVPDLLTRNLKNQFQVPKHVLMPNIECALVRQLYSQLLVCGMSATNPIGCSFLLESVTFYLHRGRLKHILKAQAPNDIDQGCTSFFSSVQGLTNYPKRSISDLSPLKHFRHIQYTIQSYLRLLFNTYAKFAFFALSTGSPSAKYHYWTIQGTITPFKF